MWRFRLQNEEEDQSAGKEVKAREKAGAMHPRRDRLDGDEAGASFGHSLGAPPGPREEEVMRLGVKG